MKLLKKIALSFFIMLSFAGVSSIAIAGATSDSVDAVVAKIAEANQAIDEGSHTSDDIVLLIRESGELVKLIISESDAFDVKRQRANGHLKKARVAAKKGKLADSKAHLDKASEAFSNLKKLI